jgi:integrase
VNEWEWLDRAPRVRMLKEPTRRIRFLAQEEAQRLLALLPEHLADMAAFSLATGLRRSNVTGLHWSQLDLVRRVAWVHSDQAKARKAIAVPLNAEAVAIVRRQLGKHPTHVFSFRGSRLPKLARRPGMQPYNGPVSRVFDGMTCGIPGPVGTCSRARLFTRCRNWAGGKARDRQALRPSRCRTSRSLCGFGYAL